VFLLTYLVTSLSLAIPLLHHYISHDDLTLHDMPLLSQFDNIRRCARYNCTRGSTLLHPITTERALSPVFQDYESWPLGYKQIQQKHSRLTEGDKFEVLRHLIVQPMTLVKTLTL